MGVIKSINVFVEKAADNTYWGTTEGLPGVVSAFGNTLKELKTNLREALNDQLELAEELEESWSSDFKNVKFNYKLDIKGFFELVDEIKLAGIAEKANVNRSLLQRYKRGETCSEEQALKIQNAVHELGRELTSVNLI